jgi:aminoglycoside 6'-N-acetyltransferase I
VADALGTIRLLADDEAVPMPLLLDADPSEEMVRQYLSGAKIFVLERSATIVGVCVVAESSNHTCEIKNIAVAKEVQNQGMGTELLRYAIAYARENGCHRIEIATGNSSIAQLYLYQKVGFEIAGVEQNYFVNNYATPIFEHGIQCKHRVLLAMAL